jgi:pimeloyl-ACP methyl ester carboxylesterase
MQVAVNGHIAYAYTGARGAIATQPNVVFVHGAANDHGVWALQSRYFAHHGSNVYAVDLPGHGRSAGPAAPAVDALAAWLVDFLDAAAIAQAVLVGHSLGALAALAAAARVPDRITRLALLGPAVPMPVSEVLLAAAKADDHLAYELINGWSFSAGGKLGGNRQPGVWMTGNAMRLMERTPPGVLYTDLAACNDYAAGLAAARAVRCPVLLLQGARDVMAPPANTRELAGALRDVRTVMLSGCGHAMMAEQPDAVLDALRPFVTPARSG